MWISPHTKFVSFIRVIALCIFCCWLCLVNEWERSKLNWKDDWRIQDSTDGISPLHYHIHVTVYIDTNGTLSVKFDVDALLWIILKLLCVPYCKYICILWNMNGSWARENYFVYRSVLFVLLSFHVCVRTGLDLFLSAEIAYCWGFLSHFFLAS